MARTKQTARQPTAEESRRRFLEKMARDHKRDKADAALAKKTKRKADAKMGAKKKIEKTEKVKKATTTTTTTTKVDAATRTE
jgi:hypothetical protein